MYRLNSQHIPKDFPRTFDAHIYFDQKNFKFASDLREQAIIHFEGQEVFVGDMIDAKVGPHPLPMFEINFPEKLFQPVVLWLLDHHGELSVLVHKLVGDDYIDHTDMALWMGKQIELDFSKFKSAP